MVLTAPASEIESPGFLSTPGLLPSPGPLSSQGLLSSPEPLSSQGFLSTARVKAAPAHPRSTGASPSGSDLKEALINSLMVGLIQGENTLLDWYRDPSALAEEGCTVPTRDTIGRAIGFTQRLRRSLSELSDERPVLPLRGVTMGVGGGISMEFAHGPNAMTYFIKANGSAERMTFVSNRLRQRISVKLS